MLKTKPILLFLLKSVLIFIVLVAPLSFYDNTYGKFYRATCRYIFGTFHKTGFTIFKETNSAVVTHVQIGNTTKILPDGTTTLANADFNTRYRGYIPTVFFISLLIASPITWKRKILSFIIGFILLTAVIMFKQWIHLLYLCQQFDFLSLCNYTPEEKSRIEFYYVNFANYSGSSLIIVIVIWVFVTFRKNDLELIKN